MKTYWTCWVEGTNGGYGRPQATFEEAQKESERLAQLSGNEGKKVFVMQCIGYTIVKKTEWIPVEVDEIPF